MHICPHCKHRTLSNRAVRWSYRGNPARCSECGSLSHVLASTSNGIFGTGIVLLSLTAAVAMVFQSYLVAVAGLLLAVAHNVWAWGRVELIPIREEAAKKAARVTLGVNAVIILARLFSS